MTADTVGKVCLSLHSLSLQTIGSKERTLPLHLPFTPLDTLYPS